MTADHTETGLAAGLPAAAIGAAGAQVLSPQVAAYSHADAIVFFTVILVIAPATAGAVVRARASLAGRLGQAARRLQEAWAGATAAAVAQERQRIATELEAIMLRGLDGMRRHAGARDREEVAELERIARGTLAGMRGLLARFRSGDDVADISGARRASTDHVSTGRLPLHCRTCGPVWRAAWPRRPPSWGRPLRFPAAGPCRPHGR
jgi:hypothetical protein